MYFMRILLDTTKYTGIFEVYSIQFISLFIVVILKNTNYRNTYIRIIYACSMKMMYAKNISTNKR